MYRWIGMMLSGGVLSLLSFTVGASTSAPSLAQGLDGRVLRPLSKAFQPKVIYGADNRQEFYQVQDDHLKQLSRSVALVVERSDIFESLNESLNRLRLIHVGDDLNLCREEVFYNQYMSGFCTAFLVADDVVATAGHCFRDAFSACYVSAFVFDWHMKDSQHTPTSAPSDNIYTCKEVMVSQMDPHDYALIRLDRKVVGREALKLRPSGRVAVGEKVLAMGHPYGLPLKMVREARVRQVFKSSFVANLDTYKGNSGSPVISETTREVVGVFVGGDVDLEYRNDQQCYISKRCGDNECDGEVSTKISVLVSRLKDIVKLKPADPPEWGLLEK